MFAAFLAPIVMVVGGSIDMSHALAQRAKVAVALDAAGLAAAKTMTADPEQLLSITQAFLAANLDAATYARISTLSVTSDGPSVTLTGGLTVQTSFLAAAGVSSIFLPVEAEIVRSTRKIELAIALDNTGSMAGSGKIGALRDAAESLVTGLFANDSTGDKVRVGLVPYVTAVNVRGEGFSWDWIDSQAQSTHHGANFTPRANHLDLFNEAGVPWKGCVEMRAAPYDLTDTAPDTGAPDTLWTPYFWPDEPQPGGSGQKYDNDYIADDETFCAACAGLSGEDLRIAQQRDTAKYAAAPSIGRDETPGNTSGPNKSCADPITPLTNNSAGLISSIRAMEAWNASGTNGAAGLAWAWRVLSPGAPYTQGAPYEEADVMKALVMMTDGENIIYGGWDSPNKSNYSSYGYLSEERLGTTSKSTAANEINSRITQLCNAIKAQGVTIFTVTFKLNSAPLKSVYRNCASKPEFYFDSESNGALVDHFTLIAGELSELRVAR